MKKLGGTLVPGRDDADISRLIVVFLRAYAGKTQADFGRDSRIAQADISRFELGRQAPPEEILRRMAKAAGIPWSEVVFLRHSYFAVFARLARRAEEPSFTAQAPRLDHEALEHALLTATPYFLAVTAPEPGPAPEEDQREAEEVWEALKRFPAGQRRRLVELAPPSSRNRVLAALVAAASTRASGTEEASDLAELASLIAARIP
jgi:transcriptional regulator with XRE-family HTH domain